LVANEITKMFTNQIYSLKKLTYVYNPKYHLNISFLYVPGTRDLLELCCSSNLPSDFFYQLSQICHNLLSIFILFKGYAPNELNELKGLISLQKNLKSLALSAFVNSSWANIIPDVIQHSQTITKLRLYSEKDNLPFSFVSSFTNLQEFIFSFYDGVYFEGFKKLQYANFSKLEILKIPYQCPYVIKFLENNGKNLKKFYYTGEMNKALNLSIVRFCPKIRNLCVIFNEDEIDILKNILTSCKYLESIKVLCGSNCLNEKDILDIVANYSLNNFHELKICGSYYSISTSFDVSPKDLESFIVSWKNRTPKKLLSLIFINKSISGKIVEILEKYENLGIIRFNTKTLREEEEDEELNY
jgi:hypothetical protein